MFCALLGALMKILLCSVADRHNSYKKWMLISIFTFALSTSLLAIIPFKPHLLFNEPHPRLIWFLVASSLLVANGSLGVIITLGDVFVINKCLASKSGEHFGQYRYVGALGWATSALGLAVVENYVQLPYLALPCLVVCFIILVDLILFTQVSNIERRNSLSLVAGISNEHLNLGKQVANIKPSSVKTQQQLNFTCTVQPNRLKQSRKSLTFGSLDSGKVYSSPVASSDTKYDPIGLDFGSIKSRDEQHIKFSEQVKLVLKLNGHDNYNLIKYLIVFVLVGSSLQIHYLFNMQYITDVLNTHQSINLLLSFNAIAQLSNCLGEVVSLLWLARLIVKHLGRDLSLMFCLLVVAARCAIFGFLVDQLGVWALACLELITGILFGLVYTLMTETASCYLSLLDRLLLVDFEPSDEHELQFVAHLEKLKEFHSIESIRFALKATVQSLFSGSCEGVGFALGPLLAGLRLSLIGDSIGELYREMSLMLLLLLCLYLILELLFVRLLFGARSKVDQLTVGCQSKLT